MRYEFLNQGLTHIPFSVDVGKAGVMVTEYGFILVDQRQKTNVDHIYAIGDIIGQPMLAHKSVHEGKVAAEVIYHSDKKRC